MRFRSAVVLGRMTLATLGLIALSPFGAASEAAAQDASRIATILDNSRACVTSCDDGNPCTVESCDRHGRCRNVDLARCNNPHAATLPLPSGSSCTPITSCSIPDADGDGLNDAWEIQGGIDLNCDGEIDRAHDLILPGADPLRKDVYLEYDYMFLPDEGTACAATAECGAGQSCLEGICRGHSHRPHAQAIRAVVDAFARQGIALHVDRGHALLHSAVVTFDPVDPFCSGSDAVNFYDLKARFFDSRRTLAYHYAVFGHYNTCGSGYECGLCPTATAFGGGGKAELPGNDLIISTGSFFDLLGLQPGTEGEAGLFMHELGHNLNLRHGGDSELPDFKPNYLSAINGDFTYAGIAVADGPRSTTPISCRVTADCPPEAICGSLSHVCTRIDYSSQALPTLDEHDLDENVGIGAGTNDITTYACPASMEWEARSGAGIGPIDWNCNGVATETNVTADVNSDSAPPTSTFTTLLTGHADWPNLLLAFQCTAGGSEDAPPPPHTVPRELTIPEAMGKHVLIARRNVEVQGVTGALSERPIAILGTDDLDVADIDGSSLKLAGARPVRTSVADINGDGRADLVLTFEGEHARRGSGGRPLHLTGWLKSSQAFDAEVRP